MSQILAIDLVYIQGSYLLPGISLLIEMFKHVQILLLIPQYKIQFIKLNTVPEPETAHEVFAFYGES